MWLFNRDAVGESVRRAQVCYCLKAWQELPASVRTGGRPSKDEALQAVAVVNRIRRAIADVSAGGGGRNAFARHGSCDCSSDS
jgi:hypothetical protein